MPILKSSKKALRRSRRKAKSNLVVRELYKEALKKARKNPTEANLKKAYSLLDKAAKTNVIHKNKASRLKSRLARLASKKSPGETKPVKKIAKKTTKKSTKKTTEVKEVK